MQTCLREIQVLGRATQEWIDQPKCPAFSSHGIRDVGLTWAAPGYSFCRLAPRIAMVIATVSGVGQVWVKGRWKECQAGDVYFTPADAPHAYQAIKGKKWHICWVIYQEGRKRTAVPSNHAQLRRHSSDGLLHAVMGLYNEVHSFNEGAAVHYWVELVDLSARRLIHEQRIDERLLRLWSAVDKELGRPWMLESLATQVHLSPEQLRHLCQKYLGHSPMEYLTHLRMKRATILLMRTNQKIAVIAEDVGYENPFAFSTAFKRVIGVSPHEFSRTHEGRME